MIRWLFGFLLLLSLGCTAEPDTLSEKNRRRVDSMFLKVVDSLRLNLDSVCLAHRDSLIRLRYDSIVSARKQKIHELSQ